MFNFFYKEVIIKLNFIVKKAADSNILATGSDYDSQEDLEMDSCYSSGELLRNSKSYFIFNP